MIQNNTYNKENYFYHLKLYEAPFNKLFPILMNITSYNTNKLRKQTSQLYV